MGICFSSFSARFKFNVMMLYLTGCSGILCVNVFFD